VNSWNRISRRQENEILLCYGRTIIFRGPGTDAALSLIAPRERQHNRFPKKETNVQLDGTQ
jgi:hypothetical protein